MVVQRRQIFSEKSSVNKVVNKVCVVIFACISPAAHINGIIRTIPESEGVTWKDDL